VTRLLVAEIVEYAGRDFSVEAAILGADVEVHRFAFDGDVKSLIEACDGMEIIMTDFVPFSRDVIKQLESCRLICVAATGYSTIDIAAAAEAGISVCAIDEYCTDEVADHTILLMLAMCRRLLEYDRQVQIGHDWRFDTMTGLYRMRDLTLGLIGYGRIGRAVARRAAAFGMEVIAYDPHIGHADIELCSLDELFDRAHVISLHSNLSPENRHMIDAAAFARMRNNPVLINVARGELIDEAALLAALDDGTISAAALDVLADESPDLAGSGLLGRSNVLLTPHVAFYSDASVLENRSISASNVRNFLDGKHDNVRRYVHRAPRQM